MIPRLLNTLKTSSFFLFGARGTGKSTYIKSNFAENSLYLDLLDPVLEDRLIRNPKDLEIIIGKNEPEWIIIDEVQKAPRLLDVIHSLIESKRLKFILTGSSARKLKRGSANLLAGRAFVYNLFPLTANELDIEFRLEDLLQFGSLPQVINYTSEREKKAYLQSYALTYIKEEIVAEQVTRKLEPFRNFLRIAAEQSGKIINYSEIAKQIGISHKTVISYFSILEDTLIGYILPSFHLSVRKSQLVSPKFYFFDLGVKNSLAESIDLKPTPQTSYFGEAFEHFIILESLRLNSYIETNYRLSYLKTKANFEIDLILSKGKNNFFIEIKSADRIDPDKVNHFKKCVADIKAVTGLYYISRDKSDVTINDVRCMYWRDFLNLFFKQS
jgi:predicted AAA+ superfamily ATPase